MTTPPPGLSSRSVGCISRMDGFHSAAITTGNVTTSVMDDEYCSATASFDQQRGGLASIGEALGRSMVLIFSIWDDMVVYMNLLGSGDAGPCGSTEGNPTVIEAEHPVVQVTFKKIRYGEIGSTF